MGTSAALDESVGSVVALASSASAGPSVVLGASEALDDSGVVLASPASIASTPGASFALESSISIVTGEPPYAGCLLRLPSSSGAVPPYIGCNIGCDRDV